MISQHKAGQFRLGKQISQEDGSDRPFAMSCRRCEKVDLAFLDFTLGSGPDASLKPDCCHEAWTET
jgi:hypothetical protein